MEQKEQKLPPPTAARDSGLELSNSNGKKGVPTWVKWFAGAGSVIFVGGGLIAVKSIRENYFNNEVKDDAEIPESEEGIGKDMERQAKNDESLEKMREKNKGANENFQELLKQREMERKEEKVEDSPLLQNFANELRERTRAERELMAKKRELNEKTIEEFTLKILDKVKEFGNDNLSQVFSFLTGLWNQLRLSPGEGLQYNMLKRFFRKSALDFACGEVSIGLSKKNVQVGREEDGKRYSKRKNEYVTKYKKIFKEVDVFSINFMKGERKNEFEIEILSDKKFRFKNSFELPAEFECQDLKLN